MKYVDSRVNENLEKYKRELIYKHVYECYQRIEKKENIDIIIKQHRKFINNLEIKGSSKSKFKTLSQLIVYKNSKDKVDALSCFSNYLNNLKLLH
tara:strand:- start:167 stop:451 length:285 start_codon:yes stop_codon:yes gene_type:complete